MFDNEITLVKEIPYKNDIGQEKVYEEYTTVLCSISSVTRTEFYQAATVGINPSKVFVIKNYEYSDQTFVYFNNEKYKIIRTYSNDFEEIELTCEKVKHEQ